MPDPKTHAAKRNFIETILRYVPGFRGYLEREYRRESDELLRNWLADHLQRSKRSLEEAARGLSDASALDLLPQLDRLRWRLDRLLGRIRGAMQGYSGFFDLVRIDVPLLDEIYQYDAALNEQVEALAAAIARLPESLGRISQVLGELLKQLEDLEHRWDMREDLLRSLKQAQPQTSLEQEKQSS